MAAWLGPPSRWQMPILAACLIRLHAIVACSGVAVTGALLDATGSWSWALFAPSVFFFVTGIAVFTAFGSSDLQDFDGADGAPFWCA